MWGFLRDWLRFGALPDDRELQGDLIAVEYRFNRQDAILLKRKDDMRKRSLASPDEGDALALTFAYPVALHRSIHRELLRSTERLTHSGLTES